MLREVVYTEAGDARRRLCHRRALEVLAEAGESAAVLAHHAWAAGLPQAAFRHSFAAGREALGLSAVSEASIHLELARQLVREGSLPKIPAAADLRDLYTQLGRAYQVSGLTDMAQSMKAERDQVG